MNNSIQEKSSAPALTRGILVLRFLVQHGESSLEKLAKALSIPKSSLIRILGVLIDLGLVAREKQNDSYYALQQSIAIVPTADRLRENIRDALRGIAKDMQQTAEWYVVVEGRLILLDRVEPLDKEVKILARIGFIRVWNDEIEAVSSIGYAWECAPLSTDEKFWLYHGDGIRKSLSLSQAQSLIEKIRIKGCASDRFFNINGVRRIAVPVVFDGKLEGILAAAEFLTPNQANNQDQNIEILCNYAARLSQQWMP